MRPKLALTPSTAASIVIEPLAATMNPQVMHREATQKVSKGAGKFGGVLTHLTKLVRGACESMQRLYFVVVFRWPSMRYDDRARS